MRLLCPSGWEPSPTRNPLLLLSAVCLLRVPSVPTPTSFSFPSFRVIVLADLFDWMPFFPLPLRPPHWVEPFFGSNVFIWAFFCVSVPDRFIVRWPESSLFNYFLPDFVCTVLTGSSVATGLIATHQNCSNEGQEVVVPLVTSNPCITCMCKVGVFRRSFFQPPKNQKTNARTKNNDASNRRKSSIPQDGWPANVSEMGCNARLLSNRLDGVVPRFPLRRRKRKEPENGDLTGRPRPFDHLATAKMSTKSFHCLSSTGCVGRFSFRRAFFFTPLRRFIFFARAFLQSCPAPPAGCRVAGPFPSAVPPNAHFR